MLKCWFLKISIVVFRLIFFSIRFGFSFLFLCNIWLFRISMWLVGVLEYIVLLVVSWGNWWCSVLGSLVWVGMCCGVVVGVCSGGMFSGMVVMVVVGVVGGVGLVEGIGEGVGVGVGVFVCSGVGVCG